MKSERLLFVLISLLLIAILTSCSSSVTPTNNPIPSPTTVSLLTSTETLPPTSTLQPTELPQETATVVPTQTEWLFQVTVTLEQLGPVLGGTLGGQSGYNWGILETQTPIQEGISPTGVRYEGEGLPQMCARGVLVDGQPMVTSLTNGACPVEAPVP